jgi:hypothetical protein
MKNKYTIMLLLSLTTSILYAQNDTISNGGFEKWDTIGAYSNPSYWYSLNELANFGYEPTTKLTTDAHSGNYAVLLETVAEPTVDLPGVLCGGPLLDANFEPDFDHAKYKFTSRPKSIQFYYKVYPGLSDTCAMIMILTKWNQTTGFADTVGVAESYFTTTVDTYTLADLEFDYQLSVAPDSAFVIFSTSLNSYFPVVGGQFYIDDVQLVYNVTGIEDVVSQQSFSVYPNPVNASLTIDAKQVKNATLSLYDNTGKMVYSQQVDQENNTIDLSSYKEGFYLLMLRDENNKTSFQKIMIQH